MLVSRCPMLDARCCCVYFAPSCSSSSFFVFHFIYTFASSRAIPYMCIYWCAYYCIDEFILTCVYSITTWRGSRVSSPWHRCEAQEGIPMMATAAATATVAAMRFTLANLRQRATESAEFIDRLINHNSKSRKRNGFLFCRFSFLLFFCFYIYVYIFRRSFASRAPKE